MPEAQPRDMNNRGVLSPLATVGRKYVLMSHSQGEGPNFYQNVFFCLKFGRKVANIALFNGFLWHTEDYDSRRFIITRGGSRGIIM